MVSGIEREREGVDQLVDLVFFSVKLTILIGIDKCGPRWDAVFGIWK